MSTRLDAVALTEAQGHGDAPINDGPRTMFGVGRGRSSWSRPRRPAASRAGFPAPRGRHVIFSPRLASLTPISP